MKKLWLVSLFLGFLSASALAQQSDTDTCDPYPDIPVTVTPVMSGATYDYTTSIGGLKTLEASTPHFYERLLLGVTSYTPVSEVTDYPKIIKMANGGECVKITNVEVKIGYDNIVMHVANEIPQGTCGFNEVVAHEQRHVATNQQVFQQYIPQIQQKLQAYLKLNGVLEERNYGYTMTVLHDNMKNIMNQILQEMSQQEQGYQQQIDTDGEFRRLVQSCNGQLAQVARQFRATGQ